MKTEKEVKELIDDLQEEIEIFRGRLERNQEIIIWIEKEIGFRKKVIEKLNRFYKIYGKK